MVHCCLERITAEEQDFLPFNATGDITTAEEFRDFLDNIVDMLKPHKKAEKMTNQDLVEGVPREEYLRSLSSKDSQEPLPEVLGRSTVEIGRKNFMPWQREEPLSDQNSLFKDGDLNQLAGISSLLFKNKPGHKDDGEVDPLFTALKGFTEYLIAPNSETDPVSTGDSNSVDKLDNLQYSGLGWFSRAVEYALDGSIYVGVALAVMYFASMILSGLISTVGSTCLVCALIGYSDVDVIA